jgi:uncharacterized repeat protein (TIGR01451 family)
MNRRKQVVLNLIVVLALLLSVIGIAPAAAVPAEGSTVAAPAADGPRPPKPPIDVVPLEEVTPEQALEKIDPALRDSVAKGGHDLVGVYATVLAGTDVSRYFVNMIQRPVIFGGTQNVYGQVAVSDLVSLAQESGVIAIFSTTGERDKPLDEDKAIPSQAQLKARLDALRAEAVSYEEAQANQVTAQGWFDVQDGHKSAAAWSKGFTGDGVVVGVLDDGIDFAHPDLQGTYAWVTDPASPYYGWPMAFSQVSMYYFASDVLAGSSAIASGFNGSRWVDAKTTVPGTQVAGEPLKSRISYKPLGSAVAHDYIVPRTSKSNLYRVGSFPEKNLLALYGERPAVIAVDTKVAGVYDTVYVDLDGNYDFTDEKPATKDSPEVYRDMDGDGYADISGGLLVWVSDGANPPPTADWLWGITCADSSATMKGCPDNGTLVLFAGPFDGDYTHGTQCASNIAGQGVVNGGASAQPFRINGMVQGGAPQVGLMDFGNHYYNGTDEDEFLVAALGYDGVSNSGDEVQITSNSYGNFTQMWGGWGYIGRLVTALNMSIAPSTVWVFSAGNEGPGYGPQEGEAGPTIIKAGSSTQYGSTAWDSIANANQIVYGDPNSFYAHGPNRDGSSGVDILGNGGRGAGDEGLNYYGMNGAESWATWGGTSRSAPVVAGNLALIYQAYKDRHGVWPTWDQVLALAKSGATNSVSSPFFQGAGVVNADRSTDLAAGIYGVYATPDEWQVGDWNGVEYLNFAKVAKPGSTYTKTYEVTNPSGYNVMVNLTDGVMQLITKTQMTFTTKDESLESAFNFHSPDYLMKMNSALIPTDAEVMIVRYVHPYSSFDPNYDYSTANSSWRFMLYNWTDVNGDGNLWVDKNGNGVVNHSDSPVVDNDGFHKVNYANSDIQQGEYVRMDYEFGGLAVPIIVHDPLDRMADGYFFGFQHRANDHTVKTTTFQIGVEFYKRADFPWLSLSTNSLAVPAESTATFNAVATIPANAATGAYEGVIFMNDPGNANHQAHETALPVVVNVIADLPDDGKITLGNGALENTMYQNSWTHGYFNWYGGGWTGAGDWRHYFFTVDANDLANKNLLINTTWTYTPTDFNTWVLGPTNDCASNGVGCAYPQPGLGQPDPSVFGPYTLQPIGSSEPFRAGAAYPFQTSTGGPSDWIKVPLQRTGLHELALHNVLYAGKSLAEQFKVEVGTIDVEAEVDPAIGQVIPDTLNSNVYTNTGVIDFNFTPSLGIPDLSATLSGGLATTQYNQPAVLVLPNGGVFSAWDPDNTVVPFMVNQAGTTRLKVHLIMPAGNDIDFFLVRDVNNNGLAEQGIDQQVGSSGNGTGEDEEITVNNPVLGQYLAVMAGYSVSSGGVSAAWWYQVTAPGDVPSDPVTVFSNTVAITQTPFVTSTNTYTYVVTADDRAGALHVSLGGFTSTANLDLYVSNAAGQIVASATTTATTEMVTVKPAAGQYRFAAGTRYTVWVHGKSVPTPPASADLQIWWDHLNVWLTAAHPDVHVNAINPGETVSVTLHFDKPTWTVGDDPLSVRLIGSMSVMPNALDELVTINRTNVPTPQFDVKTHMVGETSRGPSPLIFADSFGYGLGAAALTAAGEPITYTVTVTNTGDASGTALLESYWGNVRQSFQQFVVTPTNYVTFTVGTTSGFDITRTLAPGEVWTVSFVNLWLGPAGSSYAIFADLYDDDTASYFGEAKSAWFIGNYRTFSTSSTNGFAAYTYKLSSAPEVLPGETFTYTISMLNPSSVAQPITVTDVLSTAVNFVSATGGATYNAGNRTVTWAGTVPGTSLTPTTFDIVVTMGSSVAGATVVNTANFYSGTSGASITSKSASTTVLPTADLNLTKTSDRLLGSRGQTIKYTLVFKNNGPQAASPATLLDMVPAEVGVVGSSITTTKASLVPLWNASNRTVNWQGALNVGEVVTVTYDAVLNVGFPEGLAVINLARLSAPNGYDAVYESALTEVIFGNKFFLPIIVR